MPTDDLDVFRRFFEAIFNGRTDEALDLIDVGFSYINPSDAIEPGIRHGRDGLRTVVRNYADAYEDTEFEITDITEQDNEVVATISLVARSRTSGMGVENRTSWLCTFRRGKVLRVAYFNNPDEAWVIAQLEKSGPRRG
jgi:ketosteroid isomerase-like protein